MTPELPLGLDAGIAPEPSPGAGKAPFIILTPRTTPLLNEENAGGTGQEHGSPIAATGSDAGHLYPTAHERAQKDFRPVL